MMASEKFSSCIIGMLKLYEMAIYGSIELGQHWVSLLIVSLRSHTNAWNNADLQSFASQERNLMTFINNKTIFIEEHIIGNVVRKMA